MWDERPTIKIDLFRSEGNLEIGGTLVASNYSSTHLLFFRSGQTRCTICLSRVGNTGSDSRDAEFADICHVLCTSPSGRREGEDNRRGGAGSRVVLGGGEVPKTVVS